MKLHVICTCLNPAMEQSSLLVFKTIFKGFPTAEIAIYSNNLPISIQVELERWCQGGGNVGPLRLISQTISHDTFVEGLINSQNKPFWICDTDVVFFDSVEHFKAPMFAGRFEPEFQEEWTQSVHVARLHPSVAYIDPIAVRCAIREWRAKHIPVYFPNAIASMVRQQFIPSNGKVLFYDTMAGLHHAFGGTPFPDEINSRFEHLHAGTYADTISAETESLRGLFDLHKRVCHDIDNARGIASTQAQYYKDHATATD